MKRAVYIGIDPDLVKSGFAVYYPSTGKLTGTTFDFFKLKEVLQEFKNTHQNNILIRIEAGWLNKKANFRGTESQAVSDMISKKVGENHATGKLITQMCEYLQIEHELVRPTKAKVNKDFFFKLTGLETKSQEIIDAGMLIFGL